MQLLFKRNVPALLVIALEDETIDIWQHNMLCSHWWARRRWWKWRKLRLIDACIHHVHWIARYLMRESRSIRPWKWIPMLKRIQINDELLVKWITTNLKILALLDYHDNNWLIYNGPPTFNVVATTTVISYQGQEREPQRPRAKGSSYRRLSKRVNPGENVSNDTAHYHLTNKPGFRAQGFELIKDRNVHDFFKLQNDKKLASAHAASK